MDNTPNDIYSLWQRFQQGEHDLLGEIFQEHYNELYYYGLKLVTIPELVKDTVQDIFVDVWSRREKMTEIVNIKAYLFISLRRELLRRIKKLRKEKSIDGSYTEPFDFSVEDFMVKQESDLNATAVVVDCFKKLTERQREVILLRFNHELEFQDIALVLEMKIQSVRNLLFRALENIRNDMNTLDAGDVSNIEIFLFSIFRIKNNYFLS